MTSETLKRALDQKGNDKDLIEMTWKIQHQEISSDDLDSILRDTSNSIQAQYLKACLHSFGAPGVEKDCDKASVILKHLSALDFSHAKNLLGLIEGNRNITIEAANDFNALAIFNAVQEELKKLEIGEENVDAFLSKFKMIAIAILSY